MDKMDKKIGFELSGSAYNVAPNSAYEIQVAPILRRLFAFIIDMTLFVLLTLGIGRVITTPLADSVFNYSSTLEQLDVKVHEFGFSSIDEVTGEYVLIDFSLIENEAALEALIQRHGPDLVEARLGEYDDETSRYILLGDVGDQMRKLETLFHLDPEVLSLVRFKSFGTFAQAIFSSFIGQLLIFLLIPILLKNGRTLGMLLFRVGLIGSNGLRLKTSSFLIRFFLGFFLLSTAGIVFLYTLTTTLGIVYAIILLGLVVAVPKNRALHDLIGRTVVVDMDSQYIIDTYEEKIAAQKEEYKIYMANQRNAKNRS